MTNGWDKLDKGMIHVPGTTQNGVRFKTYKLFISGIVHLIFQTMVDWLKVTETTESETAIKARLL